MGFLAQSGIAAFAGLLFAFGPALFLAGSLVFFALPIFREKKLCRNGSDGPGGWRRALTVIGLFYAFAVSPLFLAAWDYSSSILFAASSFVLVWLVNVSVLVVALQVTRRYRYVAVCFGLVLLAVPPLAAFSLISPLPIAGLLFPGSGWVGVVLLLGVIALLLAGYLRIAASVLILLSGVAHATQQPAVHAANNLRLVGVSTGQGMSPALHNLNELRIERYTQLERAEQVFRQIGGQVLVFPESAFGEWHPLTQSVLSLSVQFQSVRANPELDPEPAPKRIVGGARLAVDPQSYINVLMDSSNGTVIAAQHDPIPLLGLPFFRLSDRQYPVSGKALPQTGEFPVVICNEITNVFRSLDVFNTQQPEVVWIANFGWTEHEFVVKRVQLNAEMWARLFSKQLVVAVNRHG